MGYSPWGCKQSDMAEQLTHTHTHTHTHRDLYINIYIHLYVCDLLSQKRKPNYIYISDAFIYVHFISCVEAFTIATNFLLYESSVAPNFSFAI